MRRVAVREAGTLRHHGVPNITSRNIIPVFLVHVFNVKSIICIVNYMIIRRMTMLISDIHNRTPKSGILLTDICIGDFFKTDTIL